MLHWTHCLKCKLRNYNLERVRFALRQSCYLPWRVTYKSRVLISAQVISYACHKWDTVCEFDDSSWSSQLNTHLTFSAWSYMRHKNSIHGPFNTWCLSVFRKFRCGLKKFLFYLFSVNRKRPVKPLFYSSWCRAPSVLGSGGTLPSTNWECRGNPYRHREIKRNSSQTVRRAQVWNRKTCVCHHKNSITFILFLQCF